MKNINLIAEIGMAHNGNISLAHSFIDAAAANGANAVKFQTHIAEEESTVHDKFRIKNKYLKYNSRYEYWKKTEFTIDQWFELKKHAEQKKLVFFSSPFSIKAVDLLKKINVKIWKIASGELNNYPLVEKISKFNQDIILSTGMSSMQEIKDTIKVIKKNTNKLSLAQCTSIYPCPPEQLGLNLILDLKKKFKCKVGFSDHSGNYLTAILAKAFGADFVEVHVTFDKNWVGFDTVSSVTFDELLIISKSLNFVEKIAYKKISKDQISLNLKKTKSLFEKSIFLEKDIKKNSKILFNDISFKKPAIGILAKNYKKIIGKKVKKNISKGSSLKKKDIIW